MSAISKITLKPINYELVRERMMQEASVKYDFKKEFKPQEGYYDLVKEENPIKRFLKYKWNAQKSSKIDCDMTDLSMSIQCVLLQSRGIIVNGYIGRKIECIDNKTGEIYYVETDTINSLWTTYKREVINTIPEYKSKCKKLGIKGSLKNNLPTFIEHYEEFDIANIDNKLAEEFEKFAILTHSVGNFCIGPVGFNKAKADLFSPKQVEKFDRLDLFLKSLHDKKISHCEEWFSNHIEDTFLKMYFDRIDYNEDKTVNLVTSDYIPFDTMDLIERLKTINNLIEIRGKEIVDYLNEYCISEFS